MCEALFWVKNMLDSIYCIISHSLFNIFRLNVVRRQDNHKSFKQKGDFMHLTSNN